MTPIMSMGDPHQREDQKVTRTIEEALNQFTLIAGAGSEESREACAMTLLAWVAGREWTDSPPCAHPVIRDAVIRVNDASDTTPGMRRELVRAGRDGILDTWWVPTQVVVLAFALDGRDERITGFDRLMRALARVAGWKVDRGLPPSLVGVCLVGVCLVGVCLAGACLTDADLTGVNLSGACLTGVNLSGADLTDADLAGAYGTPAGGMPPGWKQDANGRWQRDDMSRGQP